MTINLYLLGTPLIEQDNSLVEIRRQKTLALLIYLTVMAQTHRRDTLATLFWPESTQSRARAALTRRLSEVRKILGQDNITVTRETITLSASSTIWLDVKRFQQFVDDCIEDTPDCLNGLTEAAILYRDDFLSGFTLPDCPEFDEWQRFQGEELRHAYATVLDRLIELHRRRKDASRALSYARQRLALDPLNEPTHRTVMRLYVAADQQSAALRQYQQCVQLLADELGVPPSAETISLYERIRAGDPKRESILDRQTQLIKKDIDPTIAASLVARSQPDHPLLLTRDRELAQLDHFLTQAIDGAGQVVFVTGEAGQGKTTLAQAFARQARAQRPNMIVATGNCDAYTGYGEPYLPFRTLLNQLISSETSVDVIQALVDHGPNLIGLFVPGTGLLQQVRTLTPAEPELLAKLEVLVARAADQSGLMNVKQMNLFQQIASVFEALAQKRPVLLTLDDLQWSDADSIDLLFHLGRRLVKQPIMLIGCYRPAEVDLGRKNTDSDHLERHPLGRVINELQRTFGANTIDLRQADSKALVEGIVDREPNRLGVPFRTALYQHTQGNALFTIEILRDMQARHDLVQDDEGFWVEGAQLQWNQLPARVEGVIGERVGRLDPILREILQVASVMGEVFTAEVVAQVLRADVRLIVQQLGEVLDKQHHLVQSEASPRLGSQRLSHFRFQHILFQNYLYAGLAESQRGYWHEDVGLAIERLYSEQPEAPAGQLAHHFQEAGLTEKALDYLFLAGEAAMRLPAFADGEHYFEQALPLLTTLPEGVDRLQRAFKLHFSLGQIWTSTKGIGSPEAGSAYSQALALARQLNEPQKIIQVLQTLTRQAQMRSELHLARTYGEESLRLAETVGDAKLIVEANKGLWSIAHALGQHADAVTHHEKVIAFYRAQGENLGFDDAFGMASHMALVGLNLLPLGYPDKALDRCQTGLELMHRYEHALGISYCLTFEAYLHLLRGDWSKTQEVTEKSIQFANDYGFAQMRTVAEHMQGVALVRLGDVEAGIALVMQSIAEREAMEVTFGNQTALARLAEACGHAGRVSEGLSLINGVLAHPDISNDRQYEPKLHQIKGDLLLMQDMPGDALATVQQEAEACFRQAIEIAHSQQAKLWEARAMASLCRLLLSQGRDEGCRQQLADLYDWFTEGLETEDLRVVRLVLRTSP